MSSARQTAPRGRRLAGLPSLCISRIRPHRFFWLECARMSRRRKSHVKNAPTAPPAPAPAAAATASAGPAAHVRRWWPLLILVAVSFAVCASALRNGFVADDDIQILRNSFVTDYHALPEFFATDAWGFAGANLSNYYRPLQLLVYSSEYAAYGRQPWAWHLLNLCVNAAAIVAAYFLLLNLADPDLAFWACLFFALHPMHVEAVVWVAALPDLICGLLLFLAMLAYHRARSSNGGRAMLLYALSVLGFFAATLTKETALLFPLVLLSYEFFYQRRALLQLWRAWPAVAPFIAALGIYFVLRWRALGAFTPSAAPYLHLDAKQLAFAIPVVLVRYVGKLLLPLHFNFFYFAPPIVALTLASAGAILLLVLLVAMPFLLRAKQPLLAFSIAWFLLILAPALDINAVGENYFAERYLYIPSFGFAVLAGWAWLWVYRKTRARPARGAAWAALALVLAFCVVQIERRIPVFRDDQRLYQVTALASPNSARLQAGLAIAYYQAGNLPSAIERGLLAVSIEPSYPAAQLNLGNWLEESGRSADALDHLKLALALQPNDVPTLRSLAKVYVDERRWGDAEQCYRRAAQLDPDHAFYYQHFIDNLVRAEKIQAEIPSLREQAERDPSSIADWNLLGHAYATLLDWDNAIACFQHILKLQPAPGDPAVLADLATSEQRKGDFAQAIAAYQQILSLQPQNTSVRAALATALYFAGRVDESIAQLQQVLRADPAWQHADDIHAALGLDYEKQSNWSAAAGEYEQALNLNPQQQMAQQRLPVVRAHLPAN
jgi:tetratricopeptide (TPR) repeat protein